jgi:hypothetical protein
MLEGTWIWITGEPFVYENWDVFEPENRYDKYYLSYGDGNYRHDTSDAERGFVCEWDPKPTVGDQ